MVQRPLMLQNIPRAKKPQTNWGLKKNAEVLRRKIEKLWMLRGYVGVRVWLEREHEESNMWVVRSNMLNGVPPE